MRNLHQMKIKPFSLCRGTNLQTETRDVGNFRTWRSSTLRKVPEQPDLTCVELCVLDWETSTLVSLPK